MKKFFIMLAAIAVMLLNSGNLFALDNAFKNNLLKIEVTRTGENSYDLGLYTQKIYNEPIKIIHKSDSMYYFLLPETKHSITSVQTTGDIKGVIVKSYPYAGQDMTNGYTKVTVITSKPLNLSTSLRTADTSISPRLDPVRLAKLDGVFERYSSRLAQGNVPSPLLSFRKETKATTPSTAATKQTTVTKPVTKPVVATKPVVKQTVATKPSTAVKAPASTKVASMPKPVVQKPVIQVKAPAQKALTEAKAPVQKQVTASAPAKQAQKAPISLTKTQEAKKPLAQKTETPQKQKVEKPAQGAPVKQSVSKPVVAVQNKPVENKTKENKTLIAQKSEPEKNIKETSPAKKPAVSETQQQTKPAENAVKKEEKTKVEELEKQLATTKPVDAQFTTNAEAPKEVKRAEAEIPKEQTDKEVAQKNVPQKEAVQKGLPSKRNQSSGLLTLCLLPFLLVMYLHVKKSSSRKKQIANENAPENGGVDIKELLKSKTRKQPELNEAAFAQTPVETQKEALPEVEEKEEKAFGEAPSIAENVPKEEAVSGFERVANVQDIQSFEENSPVESVNNIVSEQKEEIVNLNTAEIPSVVEDNAVEELYNPITESPITESAPMPVITGSGEIYEPQTPVEAESEAQEDGATIVSSSKLTETRGFYLAKFEGSTSLVGYIQDEIYVLYNFGEIELKDTDIQSRLAQENETDSLYIVKTGGKKLMVKTTPYDMSLEMVM